MKMVPERLYLYNLNTGEPISDYYIDNSINLQATNANKIIYGGLLELDSNNKPWRYKFRITNHINNIIKNDSINTSLALISGANISNLVSENIKDGDNRFISGDIFSGDKIDKNGSLGFYHTSILVIEEGNKQEFLGWMLPGFNKFSTSRTFFSWLSPKKKYTLDANMHGEERAYVMTGEYEKVLPMDIYPSHLIKSIMVEDIELMEQLGIYEVAPEDFALCEFVCTSKINVQQIVRDGLDLVYKECM